MQSQEELFRFGRKGAKVRSVYGDASKSKLRPSNLVLIPSNTYALDLIKRKAPKLDQIETLILDEAFNMGFLEDIEALYHFRVPEESDLASDCAGCYQAYLVSMKEPEHVKIVAKELTTELVGPVLYPYQRNEN